MNNRERRVFIEGVVRQQLYDAAQKRGEEAEAFVESLLNEHSSSDRCPPWLLGWMRHEKFGHFDLRGIDITIYTDEGEVHVNVKNSYAFVNRFMRLHGHEGIVVFVVDRRESRGQAYGRLITTIGKRRRQLKGSMI